MGSKAARVIFPWPTPAALDTSVASSRRVPVLPVQVAPSLSHGEGLFLRAGLSVRTL